MDLRDKRGFTLIELLIVVAIIGIIAAIAVPGLIRARMAGNEASAVGSLRVVNSAQLTYSTTCAQGYARTMIELGKPPASGGQPFVSPDLATANPIIKSGYTITFAAGADVANAVGSCTAVNQGGPLPVVGYTLTADPISWQNSGSRNFGTSELQTLYVNQAAVSTPVTFVAGVGQAPAQALK